MVMLYNIRSAYKWIKITYEQWERGGGGNNINCFKLYISLVWKMLLMYTFMYILMHH